MPEHCVICGAVIPEGRQVCLRCELREMDAFDGTLKSGDVMRELDCDRQDADLILGIFGLPGRVKTIGLRTLRLHQLNGDIAVLLGAKGEKRREIAAILYLKRLGYSVYKPQPNAIKEDQNT